MSEIAPSASNLLVSPERIAADLEALAAITEPGRPWTRRAFTPLFLEGRRWLRQRFGEAGLQTRVDGAGNLLGRIVGSEAGLGTLMLGSHSDTVPDGGRFDGTAGVIVALEVARVLRERRIVLRHSLEVVDFLAEEVSIFGVSCIGSRGMVGLRPDEWLDRERDGLVLRNGIGDVGGDPTMSAPRDDISAFLELHIEQGPVLESEGLDIGVVTAIAGITRIEVVIEGRPDHAGTTPMTGRRDALVAAARLVVDIDAIALELSQGPAHFAATVGEFAMEPNAANVVPARVRLLIDARAERRPDMDKFIERIRERVDWIAGERDVGIAEPKVISDNQPTPCDPDIQDVLDRACDVVGAGHRRMASGAGHDTAWLARVTKAGMIFIPCKDGRSHTPEEWAETSDIALGAAVLLEAILLLDKEL